MIEGIVSYDSIRGRVENDYVGETLMMAGEMQRLEEVKKKHIIGASPEYCQMDFQEA